MKIHKMLAALALVAVSMASAGDEVSKVPPRAERMKWFTDARFGMFIHWGLYAEGANHEWLMNNEKIPVDEYERRFFKHFDPDLYDPDKWVSAAAAAGMKYIVITTKHHEGFCLWDSKFTDYKAPNTPAGRDLLRPFVDACHRHGIHVGFYYSLIDWHHPMYIIDSRNGPYRMLPEEERAKMNEGRDMKVYTQYLRNQVSELLTGYGPVDIMWFDFSFPPWGTNRLDFTKGKGREAWESEKLYKTVTDIAPNIIIDDRMDLPEAADIKTPEQCQPANGLRNAAGERIPWETCQTFSGSWGYCRDEYSWRTSGEIIRTLIDAVAKGGNLLLNVGPTARGEFDSRAMDRLESIGKWMKYNSESIYGCGPAPDWLVPPNGCAYTYNPEKNRLYVHIFSWPYAAVYLEGLAGRIEYARFLHDHSEIKFGFDRWQLEKAQTSPSCAILRIPNVPPAGVEVPVVEVFLKEPEPKKVLMIGNSFSICVGRNLPRIAASVAGCDLELTSLFIGGCSLSNHVANVHATAADPAQRQYRRDTWTAAGGKVSSEEGRSSINEELAKGDWDVVTIQQASPKSWDYSTYQPYADELVELIKKTNPKAEILIQETWAYNAADKRLGPEGKWGFDQAGMHERVKEAYATLAKVTTKELIPTGDAIALYRAKIESDEAEKKLGDVVNGHGDTIHLNKRGEYLQACVWFKRLFGRPVPENAWKPSDLAVGDEEFLRKCAMEAFAK